jgi:hypothetical protein
MSASELYEEIKAKMGYLKKLDNLAQMLKGEGKYDEYKGVMDKRIAQNETITEWVRGIVKSRTEEICQMIRRKAWPAGAPFLPGAVTEASYPEVILALSLLHDNELKEFLSPECYARYKGMR